MHPLLHSLTRRDWFNRSATGFAGLALGSLLAEERSCASGSSHHAPKARAVIQLFQHGGPSHMDLLDPKPELNKRNGEKMPESFTDLVKLTAHGNLMGTHYKFKPAGKCGVEYSELLPYTSTCADDIAVVRSMYTEHNNHEQALWMMHTGRIISGRPTIGAWVSYALGSENQNLPSYVVLRTDSSLPVDGTRNWSSGFLPPKYQGVHFRHLSNPPVLHLNPSTNITEKTQQMRLDLLKELNQQHQTQNPAIADDLEARIGSYEMAGRMQLHAAEALDLLKETAATHAMYGIGQPITDSYGRRCLIARRLIERGVRYVQIFIEAQIWDTHHKNAEGTKNCCERTDQPAAALLKDLKQRGLLDSTLVMWGGEFGRTPVSQAGEGRDHHKQGFSLWLAGGGIKGGQAYGATDELGYHAVEKRTMVADLHATILHLLGLDHERVTYHLHGRDERLTDVYEAKVVKKTFGLTGWRRDLFRITVDITVLLDDFPCPKCGGKLVGFPPESTCCGVQCLRCDYAVATTNPRQPCFDETEYSIWVEWDGTEKLRMYAVVGNALGIGARAARTFLDAGQPVRTGLQALQVKRWYRTFRKLRLTIRIEPTFPWRLDD